MASRWELLRDAAAAAVEALVPETDAGVLYHDAESDSVLQGASGRRAFWFGAPAATVMTQQSTDAITVRYEWTLYLLLSRGVATIPEFVAACTTEPLNITRALTTLGPTTGAQPIIVTGWTSADIEGTDEVRIEIAMISEVDETL